MPGLRLTSHQAARLFGVEADIALAVLDELRRASVLALSDNGSYSLISEAARRNVRGTSAGNAIERTDRMETHLGTGRLVEVSLKDASVDRLACLLRHWTWANEAKGTFERELADGWTYDDDPMADHPFGSYYHWCALWCGLSEAALEHGLLSPSQLDAIRRDLDASLPGLRACRQLLLVIPSSLEEQPRVVDLVGDEETLGRLRRVHEAFGEALREERMTREIESLDH